MPVALALIALAVAGAGPAGEGEVLDEVAAVVRAPGGEVRVVTLSKLREEARIVLVSRGANDAAFRPLDAPALKASLQWYVDQILLFDEAARLRVFEVDRTEVLGELRRFRERFARPEDYRTFLEANELSEEELMAVLRRTLRVQHYLDGRVMRTARVGDAEVETYYRAHRTDFGGMSLEQVKDPIRAHLSEERVQAEVKSLVADLRARSDVRLVGSLAPEK
jgi:hypothetical protein